MGKTLKIQMTISVDNEENQNTRSIIFYEWLPETFDHALAFETEGMTCHYWADQDCIRYVNSYRVVDGKRQNLEMLVGKLHVAINGVEIQDRLADVILRLSKETVFGPDHFDKEYDAELLQQHRELTGRIHRNVLFGYNRIIGHIRAERGQYWLDEQQHVDRNIPSDFIRYHARVRIDDSDWMRLADTRIQTLVVQGYPASRRIGSEDWTTIGRLMQRRPDIVGTLLTAADGYQSQDQARTAVIEAVSALEIAVGNFTDRSKATDWFCHSQERFGVANLRAHRKHLGFTAVVSYLLPMLFSEEQVSTEILMDCREAIDERNNIVHNGQRSVKSEKLIRYLKSIRCLCVFLQKLSPIGQDL